MFYDLDYDVTRLAGLVLAEWALHGYDTRGSSLASPTGGSPSNRPAPVPSTV